MKMQRIIAGGQTGADRVALVWAITHSIPHGGWCPPGRRAEDGAWQGAWSVEWGAIADNSTPLPHKSLAKPDCDQAIAPNPAIRKNSAMPLLGFLTRSPIIYSPESVPNRVTPQPGT
jgi:Circularly permutated YpsA SLOG family